MADSTLSDKEVMADLAARIMKRTSATRSPAPPESQTNSRASPPNVPASLTPPPKSSNAVVPSPGPSSSGPSLRGTAEQLEEARKFSIEVRCNAAISPRPSRTSVARTAARSAAKSKAARRDTTQARPVRFNAGSSLGSSPASLTPTPPATAAKPKSAPRDASWTEDSKVESLRKAVEEWKLNSEQGSARLPTELEEAKSRIEMLEKELLAVQQQNDAYARADERRRYLGTDSEYVPFGVPVRCPDGTTYSIQVQAGTRINELIRRVRTTASLSAVATPNPRIHCDGAAVGHLMMLGELGITAENNVAVFEFSYHD